MAELRIAFLTPQHFSSSSLLGGGERYVANLARGVARSGQGRVAVDIVSFGANEVSEQLEPWLRLRLLPLAGGGGDPQDALSWSISHAVAACDLLHLHQGLTRSGAFGMLAAALLHRPTVLTHHGGGTLSRDLWTELLELADQLVAYSDFGAASLPTRRVAEVIKGGVDGDLFRPADPPQRREHVLFVGRVLPHKGVDRLIQASPPDVPLLVCGGQYDERYASLVHQLARGRNVHFLEAVDDRRLVDLYQRAYCVVLPSTHRDVWGAHHPAPELMGLALLEAMACATPAVCTRVGGMPEFVRDGVDGFVVESTEKLGERIRQLVSDAQLVQRLGIEGRRAVDERWHLRVVGAAMLQLYGRVLADAGMDACAS